MSTQLNNSHTPFPRAKMPPDTLIVINGELRHWFSYIAKSCAYYIPEVAHLRVFQGLWKHLGTDTYYQPLQKP